MIPSAKLLTVLILALIAVQQTRGRPSLHSKEEARPPTPKWPDIFTVDFNVLVEQYGSDWASKGALYYDWKIKTFRGEFIDWCLPLFDSGPGEYNNYTCSFLANDQDMYFINHTGSTWNENDCCIFEKGLAAIPPDWMKIANYNGTDYIQDTVVNVWWFPGTNNASTNPCYGYWSAKDEPRGPVRFFGLTSLGPTILEYHNYQPGAIPPGIDMKLPTGKDCNKICTPPKFHNKIKKATSVTDWPFKWPTCE